MWVGGGYTYAGEILIKTVLAFIGSLSEMRASRDGLFFSRLCS
jgi:hypothetical protein